jgi:hypothetical protein
LEGLGKFKSPCHYFNKVSEGTGLFFGSEEIFFIEKNPVGCTTK